MSRATAILCGRTISAAALKNARFIDRNLFITFVAYLQYRVILFPPRLFPPPHADEAFFAV